MRAIGLVLLAAGFVAGSLLAVIEVEAVPWGWFVPALAAAVLGVALVRVAGRRAARDVTRLEADFQTLDARLRAIVGDVSALDREKGTLDVYDLPARIDLRVPAEILAFADARASIAQVFGARTYADVMSHFAAGERYLNRTWSTAADGYVDEAHAALARSREQFEEALASFEGAKAAASLPAAQPESR